MEKLIKKIKHNTLFGMLIGMLLCSGIVYGANIYQSSTIEYNPTDASWEVENVNDAINNLHIMVKELENIKTLGDATSSDIATGKTAVVQGELVEGTLEGRKEMTLTLKAVRWAWNDGNGDLRIGTTGTITTAGYDKLTIVDYSYYSDDIEYITVAGKKVQDVGKGKSINISSKTSINYTIYKSSAAADAWVKIKLS